MDDLRAPVSAWPPGDGEMARRIRAHGWAATPLGPIAAWPQSQKTAVDVMLASGHAMQLAWGPERTVLYNDAYAPMLGSRHPSALGLSLREAWPGIRGETEPLVTRVLAGETVSDENVPLVMARHGHPENTWWTFSYSPVRDELGAVAGALSVAAEVTGRMRAERERDEAHARLRGDEDRLRALVNASSNVPPTAHPDRTELRQAFLLKLADALRPPADADAVRKAATRLLGEHLGVNRALYGEMDGGDWILFGDHEQGIVPLTPGRYAASTYVGWTMETFRRGGVLTFSDARSDPRFGASERAVMERFQIAAALGVGLVRGGTLSAALVVHNARPRAWTAEDAALLSEVAERTWAAVEHAHAGAALRESEDRLQQFGKASQDVLWIRDVETLQWQYLTPAFEAIYGLSRAEALAGNNYRNWQDMILPEDWRHVSESVQRVREGEQVEFEYRIRRPADGEVRWLRNTDFPMHGADGQVQRIGGVGQDVTELKRMEAALRDSESRLRTLVEGIPQLVWRSADAGQWTWASPQWLAYTGQSEAEARGLGWLQAVHPDDRDAVMAAWREADARSEVWAGVRLFHAGEERYRWVQSRGVPVRDDRGAVVEWLGTMTDIEDQVRSRDELERRVEARTAELMTAEASLRQAQKMEAVGQLTGGIAHDFNNMLQAIAGSLELMHRRIAQGRAEEAERHVEGARRTVERAAALTHRLLAFARRQALQPRSVDPDGLAEGMAELVRRTVGPGVAVELRLGDGAWPVQCDPNQLENALLNLCINARDAMPEGGRLAIATRHVRLSATDVADQEDAAPGEYVEVAVADTGVGMDEATRARVFEPFFTTKPLGQGTGLGLSQLYGFVRQSFGVVRLDSAPGRGTTVRLYLPRHGLAGGDAETGGPGADAGPEAAGVGAGSGTVLLVDDEAGVRAVVAEHLRELGYAVVEAGDGPAALRALQGSLGARVDLLVTDVGLPDGLNGRQVAEAARERRPGLPVLFITGYAGAAFGEQLAPGMAVIGKPFTLDALAARVWAMIGSEGSA